MLHRAGRRCRPGRAIQSIPGGRCPPAPALAGGQEGWQQEPPSLLPNRVVALRVRQGAVSSLRSSRTNPLTAPHGLQNRLYGTIAYGRGRCPLLGLAVSPRPARAQRGAGTKPSLEACQAKAVKGAKRRAHASEPLTAGAWQYAVRLEGWLAIPPATRRAWGCGGKAPALQAFEGTENMACSLPSSAVSRPTGEKQLSAPSSKTKDALVLFLVGPATLDHLEAIPEGLPVLLG